MTERSVTVVDEKVDNRDWEEKVPVVNRVVLGTVKEEKSNIDDFAKPAEEIKSYSGTSPVFKRKVTNSLKKYQRGDEVGTKQVAEKEFATGYDALDVVVPPYNLDYLAKLYELSSPHYAAVNAKVANIVGLGYKLVENSKTKRNFESIDDEVEAAKIRKKLSKERDRVLDKIDTWNQEDTFLEVLVKVWRDYEVTGNGYLEIGRKKDGSIGYVGHIPASTLRIRKKRDGFVQVSGWKVQFFAHFGETIDEDGELLDNPYNPVGNDRPNEVIHIKKYSPTSGFYGIPDIAAATHAVAGNEFAARYNLDYFENKAVPRHVIVLKGARLGAAAETALISFFETGLKGKNHRTLYIPLPAGTKDEPVELSIEPIEAGIQDASFTKYRQANLSDILMVHRVPVTKISVAEGASLAVAKDADKTFKEQVCEPEQRVFEKKLEKIFKEVTDAYDFKLEEMTLTDENTQSQIDERRRKTGVETANEQRARRGDPAIEGGDELFDMNAAVKLAEMADETTRRGQDKQVEARQVATASAGANRNGNPTGTRQRDTTRSANATDSAGAARNPKGEGRTTS